MSKRIVAFLRKTASMVLVFSLIVSGSIFYSASKTDGASVKRYSVLILDTSGSMDGTPKEKQKQAAKKFCSQVLKIKGKNYVALVTLNTYGNVLCEFTNNKALLNKKIDDLDASGGTNINDALERADELLRGKKGKNVIRNIVLCTDGLPQYGEYTDKGPYKYEDYTGYDYANQAYNTAQSLKKNNKIYSLGFFHSLGGSDLVFAKRFMKDLQNAGFYNVTDPNKLKIAFGSIASKITKLTIKLNANGGKVKPKKIKVVKGKKYKNLPTPTYGKHLFKGWYTKKKGGKRIKNGDKVKINKNTTVYAHWGKKGSSSNSSNKGKKKKQKVTSYKIEYVLNDGKNSKKNPSSYTAKKLPVKLHNATRKGYSFKGWYTDKKCKKNRIKTISKGTKGKLTLYAKWKIVKYKIELYDGSKRLSVLTYNIKQTFDLPKKSKKNYTFLGWHENGNSLVYVKRIKKGTFGNKKYYASWKIKSAQTITANDIILDLASGSKNINAKTSGTGTLSYSIPESSPISISPNGTITPNSEGICEVTINASETGLHSAASKKIMVTVNSNSLYKSFNINSKLPYFNSTSINSVMCPQGLCVVDDYVLVSAYQYNKASESAVYVMDKNGNYKGMIRMGNNTAHAGGLTSDGKSVFMSSDKKILFFSKSELSRVSGGNSITLSENSGYKYVKLNGVGIQASTLTYHKGALWIAKCESSTKKFALMAIPIYYSGSDVIAEGSVENFNTLAFGAKSVNGIVFGDENSDRLYVSTSTGREHYSDLHYTYVSLDILKTTCPMLKTIMKIPPMAEGMAILNSNLAIVYESSSNLYKKPLTPDYKIKAAHPMDYLTMFRLYSID